MAGFISFELDLMKAVIGQLTPELDRMAGAPLDARSVADLPNKQGVYQLLHQGRLKYIGKTDADAGLHARLNRHRRKFMERDRIAPTDVSFKAVHIQVLTAMDLESELLRHYKTDMGQSGWNYSGFGSNDPGRERETTNKPAFGFDSQFPINIDVPHRHVAPGTYTIHELLCRLKEGLPYTLRYETTATKPNSQSYRTRPHPDYLAASVVVLHGSATTRQLIRCIVAKLPAGWQATRFVSHVILYKESRSYRHGEPL